MGGSGGRRPARRFRRFSGACGAFRRQQWGNAVKDLLGLASAPTLSNLGGEAQFAFFADTTLGVDPQFQFALYDATQQIVIPAIAVEDRRRAGDDRAMQRHDGVGADDLRADVHPDVREEGVPTPVDSTEVTNLMKRLHAGRDAGLRDRRQPDDPGVLISPSFVYRTELGPTTLTADATGKYPDTTLTPYEIASQLGFLLPRVDARRPR